MAVSRRTAASHQHGPPPLDLDVMRQLRLLILANLLPLIVGTVIAVGVATGRLHFKADAQHSLVLYGIMAGGCALLAVASWVGLPLARWLRRRPAWHFRHGSKLLWALPALLGWLAWAVLALTSIVTILAACFLIGATVVRLISG